MLPRLCVETRSGPERTLRGTIGYLKCLRETEHARDLVSNSTELRVSVLDPTALLSGSGLSKLDSYVDQAAQVEGSNLIQV